MSGLALASPPVFATTTPRREPAGCRYRCHRHTGALTAQETIQWTGGVRIEREKSHARSDRRPPNLNLFALRMRISTRAHTCSFVGARLISI